LFLGAMALSGCAATTQTLTLTSADHHRDFRQNFSHAYASLDAAGDYDIVLVHDANADTTVFGDAPMKPAPVTPRQVVHIRIFWLAEHGMKMDHPVASNASIRWYLFGDRPAEVNSLLEYSGAALVVVSDDGHVATVTVRGADMKPVARRGGMNDPLGPSSVAGTFTATLDRKSVEDALNEIKAADAAAGIQSLSAAKP
jgi:hypothetical protein